MTYVALYWDGEMERHPGDHYFAEIGETNSDTWQYQASYMLTQHAVRAARKAHYDSCAKRRKWNYGDPFCYHVFEVFSSRAVSI